MKKVCVIGAGASGMVAAGVCAEQNNKVYIIEKNNILGKKLLITGKGRCNVTNCCDTEDFINNVVTNPRFLYSSFSNFNSYDVMGFFESLGVELKVERGNRVFPSSDRSADIVNALKRYIADAGVKIIKNGVKALVIEQGVCKGVKLINNEIIECDSVIVATGGMSYPSTGSTGDGYKFARQAGHTIIKPRQSLVSLMIKENICKKLQGLSLKNVKLSLFDDDKMIFSQQGEMIFTHFGVSGPLVLSASANMKHTDYEKYRLSIDLKPALDRETLEKRLIRDFNDNINKNFKNYLPALLPSKLIDVFIDKCKINPDTKLNSITKQMRDIIIDNLKNIELSVLKTCDFDEAIVTSGGVCIDEVDPKTMQSKLVYGLFFCGEVLDVDAYTGGYNLQIAFSTGYAAGKNA